MEFLELRNAMPRVENVEGEEGEDEEEEEEEGPDESTPAAGWAAWLWFCSAVIGPRKERTQGRSLGGGCPSTRARV